MIKWPRAIVAGIAGTIVFDVIGLLLNGRWTTPAMLTGELAPVLNLPQPVGLLLQRVAAHSLAARAGLRGWQSP